MVEFLAFWFLLILHLEESGVPSEPSFIGEVMLFAGIIDMVNAFRADPHGCWALRLVIAGQAFDEFICPFASFDWFGGLQLLRMSFSYLAYGFLVLIVIYGVHGL